MSTGTEPEGDPQADATQSGLAVIAEATALRDDDPEVSLAARENLLDTVDDLVDEPLTPRQEEVVEAVAVAGGSLTAGLSGALARERRSRPEDVLTGAAAALLNTGRGGDAPGDAPGA
ncbi:hypothetical protein AS850_03935 [Frondihabitans sp. 762G35]|uniref:hypothetical protein n=1 Tax=Frondihabitans sp. 762G35 TaxID=1446794 RepID=UPI000D21509E|nr:hypothetical protein [Frondihabitans sp. 762G35]ARC56224.1 hypothetical protein AS850_03935 [Frondihabitans sp. 762G35]